MNITQQLHNLGQSLWLDNITGGLVTGGTLRRYIDEFAVTGLTSNPTIFYAEEVLAEFAQADVNDAELAAVLQREGTESFTKSWNDLLDCLASKSVTLQRADRAGGKR